MNLYICNYKYLHNNGKVRSAQVAIYANDVEDARKKAALQLENEVETHFEVGNIKLWKAETQKDLPLENGGNIKKKA